jgi:hypothetical protein
MYGFVYYHVKSNGRSRSEIIHIISRNSLIKSLMHNMIALMR